MKSRENSVKMNAKYYKEVLHIYSAGKLKFSNNIFLIDI
jgi:hypothetical protein